jgi:hypothetical protein
MLSPYNITKKSADARFFGPFHKFFLFKKNVQNPKKTEKYPKNCIFPYAQRRFSNIYALCKMLIFFTFISKIKNQKNRK